MKEYKLDPEKLAELTEETKARFCKRNPPNKFVEHGCSVFWWHLEQAISRYRQFGVYWWAVKDLLRRHGYNVGDETDEEMIQEYCGANDEQTIVLADLFMKEVASQYVYGNQDYPINETETYTLYDEDMEGRPSVKDPIV